MDLPRIAYISLWFPKPSETFIFREVVNLRKMGLDLKVFTLYGPLTRDLSPEMQLLSPHIERLGLSSLRFFWRDFLYWGKRKPAVIRRLLRTMLPGRWNNPEREGESLWGAWCGLHLARRFQEEKITHIHAVWASGPATAAWAASQLTGIPYSFTGRAHDVFTPDSLLPEKVREAALVRGDSRAALQELSALAGVACGKFQLTYNGVPLAALGPAPLRMRPPYRLLALGRFVALKGFEVLIEAGRLLVDSGVDFHLTLAGSGPRGWHLKHLARKLGLASRISFPGFISYDRVAELFYGTDIFIMPSIVQASGNRDGLPTVLLEALLHRVPVIASDVGGISEVIADGVTGCLIPPRDPQAIADAIRRMIRDRDATLAMARRGRARVQQNFDPEINHRRVLELFGEKHQVAKTERGKEVPRR
jgi:colanic acid/amylovoran biosynthesis glycosyltransferase